MSNAVGAHLSASDYLDEIIMTNAATVYRVISGPGTDAYATGVTILARVVETGEYVSLSGTNINTQATTRHQGTRRHHASTRHQGFYTGVVV